MESIAGRVIPREFYQRPALEVAQDLLGKKLVRLINGQRLAGTIMETEAYQGEEDLACHARSGITPRTKVMYGEAGHAYVYFTYGIHWLLNCVTGEVGFPAAVLIRSIHPEEGLHWISEKRPGKNKSQWTNGPAKICAALQIDGALNGKPLFTADQGLFIENHLSIPPETIIQGPRIGIQNVPEPWRSKPWRFHITELSQLGI